jgi:hypothetical protein
MKTYYSNPGIRLSIDMVYFDKAMRELDSSQIKQNSALNNQSSGLSGKNSFDIQIIRMDSHAKC